MGLPITVRIDGDNVNSRHFNTVFNYFRYVDKKFSPFKEDSEVSLINNGLLREEEYSQDMKEILRLSDETKKETGGFFNIKKGDKIDPSGIVKGWAIKRAADILKKMGYKNYYVDAGGDIQVSGNNLESRPWKVGIRNPFNRNENVKVLGITDKAVATSGTYIRGQHIYNPHDKGDKVDAVLSLTVIGRNIYDADRFATAAFAMGREGIYFLEKLRGFEGYMIDKNGVGTETSGFGKYLL